MSKAMSASTDATRAGRGRHDVATRLYDGVAGIYGGDWSGPVYVLAHRSDDRPGEPRAWKATVVASIDGPGNRIRSAAQLERRLVVAFLLTHFWPGGTEEQYRAMIAAVHPPNGLPDGQLHHAAGETEGGYLISAVWDSKESSDQFVNGVLLASLPVEGGFEGQPDERTAEISNLETAQ